MAQSEFDRKIKVSAGILADLTVEQQRSQERAARTERILMMAVRAGRRERREWRERHAALIKAQADLTEAQGRTEAKLGRLADAQEHSDRRLDALIDIVRQDRGRENGRRRGEAKDEGGEAS